MNNGKRAGFEQTLRDAFEAGYLNAALSLSRVTGGGISFNNFEFHNDRIDAAGFRAGIQDNREGTDLLLTTEIFGDISGKSYLLLSVDELEWLTGKIPSHASQHETMTEEYIKEIDNILSASVITWLSNHLERKVYGHLPIIKGIVTRRMEDIIAEDFKNNTQDIYVNSVSFSVENQPNVHPTFVWAIDTRISVQTQPKTTII